MSACDPKTALNRADLLRIYAQQGREGLNEAAEWLGFAPVPRTVDVGAEEIQVGIERKGKPPVFPEPQITQHPEPTPSIFGQSRYFVLTERETIQPPPTPQGQVLAGDQRNDDAPLPRPLPLVRQARLLPFLQQELAATWSGRNLDMGRVLAALTRGKALKRLPFQPRQGFAGQICVLLDVNPTTWPYRPDFLRLTQQLRRLRGQAGLDVRVLADEPSAQPHWQSPQGGPVHVWQMPAAGVPLLILSDLGCNRDEPLAQYGWMLFGRQLQAAGIRPLVLCPAPAARHRPRLRALFDMVAWDEAAGRLRKSTPGTQTAQPTASASVARLLALAAPCIQVEPALVRALRHLLSAEDADAGVEADLWQHPDVSPDMASYSLASPEAQARHQAELARLAQDPALRPQVEQAIALIQAHHAALPDSMRWAELDVCERLIPGVLDGDTLAQLERWRADMACTVQQRAAQLPALHAWAGRQLQRYHGPTLNDNDLAASLWLSQHQTALRRGETSSVPEGMSAIKLLKLINQDPHGPGRLLQRNNHLHLVRSGDISYSNDVQLAQLMLLSNPLACRLEYKDGQRQWLHALGPAQHSLCPLDDDVLALEMRTPWERWRLEGKQKPAWACELHRDQNGLHAALRLKVDAKPVSRSGTKNTDALPTNEQFVWLHWQEPEDDGTGHWHADGPVAGWQAPGPMREDQYGLYAEFSVNGVTQRVRWIQPGMFMMGSPDSEPERYSDEGPQHEVTLSGYWLADTACTQALWRAVMGSNPARFKGDERNPLETVSWDDCIAFFDELNQMKPELMAWFPSEAQWEYACRAGTTTPFSFGTNITPEQVNYDGDRPYAGGAKGLNRKKTVPVASLAANAWGLYEMHGNVWEWCSDWFDNYAAEPQTDPEGPSQGSGRVLRGGSWINFGPCVHSAYRFRHDPGYRSGVIGLRLSPGRRAQAGSAEPTTPDTSKDKQRLSGSELQAPFGDWNISRSPISRLAEAVMVKLKNKPTWPQPKRRKK